MKEIGIKLREAREKKNISIADAANATKISSKIISAIEDGNESGLPAKSYLRGFVQTYAKYLDLNIDEIMKIFLETQGSTKPKPLTEAETALLEKTNHDKVQSRIEIYKKIAYVAAALIAFVLIYGIHRVVDRYEKEAKTAKENKEVVQSQLAPSAQTTSVQAPTEVAPSSAAIETTAPNLVKSDTKNTTSAATTEQAKPDVTEKITANPLAVEKSAMPSEKKVDEIKKTNADKTQALATATTNTVPNKETVPVVTATENSDSAKEKADEPKKEATKRQEIILEALDKVSVTYKKDSDEEKTIYLKPEQILTIHAKSKISLKINDGGAINITHNGHDNGVPGSLGQPSTLNFP